MAYEKILLSIFFCFGILHGTRRFIWFAWTEQEPQITQSGLYLDCKLQAPKYGKRQYVMK
jgi:hypothetical protein